MEYCDIMRWTNRIIAVLGAVLVSSTVDAVPASELKENYQSIIERNPFGLKPIPPPPTNNVEQVKGEAQDGNLSDGYHFGRLSEAAQAGLLLYTGTREERRDLLRFDRRGQQGRDQNPDH